MSAAPIDAADGSFELTLSPDPHEGNWLALDENSMAFWCDFVLRELQRDGIIVLTASGARGGDSRSTPRHSRGARCGDAHTLPDDFGE